MHDERGVVVERVSGRGVIFLRLSGRIDERFDRDALGALDAPLAIDLAGVRAITSFGVQRLSTAIRAIPAGVPAYLIECPPCIVDQMNIVQGFIGAAEVLSARALFACACGMEEERVVDVLGEGSRIRAGRPPDAVCSRCAGQMRLVEDDSFRFVTAKGARKLDPRVGAMLTGLGLYATGSLEHRPLAVRKVVDGPNVALKLDGSIVESTRIERVADDEGIVVLLLGGITVRGDGAESLSRLLSAIARTAQELVLVGVPPQLAGLFSTGAIAVGSARIATLLVPVRCDDCEGLALASLQMHEPEATPRCPRCGTHAKILSPPRALDKLCAGGPPSAEARSLVERLDGLFSQAAVEARLVQQSRGEARTDSNPAQIGGYKILRPLSAGGMAEVLLATRESLGGVEKLVALKLFRRELFQAAPAAIAMFLAEARLAAQLSHPNVVQIFDVGEADGDLYMAMELVDGRDLRDVIDEGHPTPPHIVAHLGVEIARALAYLHTARDLRGRPMKIVHRDVSPQNVIVDRSGRVVLIDFGVALAGEGELQKRRRKVAGNLAFMSPEQCYGEPLDGRSDLFSLGVVLWELLTAQPLFRRYTAQETRAALIEGVIPPLPKSVPPQLDALVRRLLKPDREARPASAEVVAQELDAMIPTLGGRCTPAELGAYVANVLKPGPPSDPVAANAPTSVPAPDSASSSSAPVGESKTMLLVIAAVGLLIAAIVLVLLLRR